MADNVTIPAQGIGSATPVVATDDIGGIQFQRVKVTLGADGVNNGDVSAANPMPVDGPLTDAELRAVAVPVDGSGVTQPVSAVALPLPAGAATEATLATLTTPADTQPISAVALPLPAGAATEATLGTINGKVPALGQAAMAASVPVVIANNQSAVPVSGPLTNAELRATPVALNDDSFGLLLREILASVNMPVWYSPTINGLTVGGAVTISSGTVTTVTTVAGLTNIGSLPASGVVLDTSGAAWATCIRNILA
jgi:hypothetical protein